MSTEPPPPEPPRLLDRVRHAARIRHYSLRTEESYVNWIRRFILFHGKRHPSSMGADEVNTFLSHLAVVGKVAAATQGQALSAKPRRLPVVLTRDEVGFVLGRLSGSWWLMGMLLYGAGLRQMECLRLRV